MISQEPKCKNIRIPSTLREIADNNLFFFDKTKEIIKLTKIRHSQAFIARPRYFGKTMTVDILYHLFSGNKEIFEKLNAKCLEEWDFSTKHTVLVLKLNINIVTYDHFIQTLKNYLWMVARKHQIQINLSQELSPTDILTEILINLTENNKKEIIVLIDDFDYCLFTKPQDISFKPYVALLGSLVNVFKVYKDSIRLCLYFGVHYFSSNTIGNFFSSPPDISADPEIASVFGFTKEEILEQFPERLEYLLKLFQQSKIQNPLKESEESLCECVNDIVDYLIYFYGGFRFSPYINTTVLNPYETLSILQNYRFNNYWIKNILDIHYLYASPALLANFSSIFNSFYNFENFFIECLVPLIKGQLTLSSSFIEKYRYIFDYGFLTFESQKQNISDPTISIPNISIYEFLANILIQKMSQQYHPQLTSVQVDKIDQGNIPQILDCLKKILIEPHQKSSEESNSVTLDGKSPLLALFKTWEIKVFAALDSLGIRVNMKIPRSDYFYQAECEMSRSVIHLFASTNCDPSIKQILTVIDQFGKNIPLISQKNNIFCVLSCTTFTHSMKFDATWNNVQNSEEMLNFFGRINACNHDFSNFNMNMFSFYETTIFQNDEDKILTPENLKSKNLISLVDVVFQVILQMDAKEATKSKVQPLFSAEQITAVLMKVFSYSQPFQQFLNQVKLCIQFLFETNKIMRVVKAENYLYGIKK